MLGFTMQTNEINKSNLRNAAYRDKSNLINFYIEHVDITDRSLRNRDTVFGSNIRKIDLANSMESTLSEMTDVRILIFQMR